MECAHSSCIASKSDDNTAPPRAAGPVVTCFSVVANLTSHSCCWSCQQLYVFVWLPRLSCTAVTLLQNALSRFYELDSGPDSLGSPVTLEQLTSPLALCLPCGFWSQRKLGYNPGSIITGCVTMGKLLSLLRLDSSGCKEYNVDCLTMSNDVMYRLFSSVPKTQSKNKYFSISGPYAFWKE